MVQCTNGSRAQSAAPAYFWFTWSAFIAWAAIRLGRLGTIIWVFFADSPFNVTEFCETEPSIPTAPTTAQWLGFFTLDFSARLYVEQYLLACFKAYLWPTYCECIPAAAGTCYADLPTAALPDANPSLTNYRFGAEFYAKVTGLWLYGVTVRLSNVGAGTFDVKASDQHAGTTHTETFAGVAGLHTYTFSTPVQMVNVSSGFLYDIEILFTSSGYGMTSHNGTFVTPVDTVNLHYNQYIYQSDLTSGALSYPGTLPICPEICTFGGPSGTPIDYTAPLPTDPTDIPDHPEFTCSTTADVCSRIDALQQAIALTRGEVNWLQSAIAPTCWVAGTAHTGLTGAGTIAVADAVGAYVTMTLPTIHGRTLETPPRSIPKAGELQWAVDGVVVDDNQLHYEAQQVLGAPNAANSIVYNFRQGVTASITPLYRCK